MKDALRALILDQRNRALHIQELVSEVRKDPELTEQKQALGEDLRAGERDLAESLSLLGKGDEGGARFFLQSAETSLWKAERRLAALARYRDDDKLLTLVTHRLCDEIGRPGRKPLVCCTADAGYRTWGEADLIFVAPVDHRRVLAWPDICHEMGHALVAANGMDLDEFSGVTVLEYFKVLAARPPARPSWGCQMILTQRLTGTSQRSGEAPPGWIGPRSSPATSSERMWGVPAMRASI